MKPMDPCITELPDEEDDHEHTGLINEPLQPSRIGIDGDLSAGVSINSFAPKTSQIDPYQSVERFEWDAGEEEYIGAKLHHALPRSWKEVSTFWIPHTLATATIALTVFTIVITIIHEVTK